MSRNELGAMGFKMLYPDGAMCFAWRNLDENLNSYFPEDSTDPKSSALNEITKCDTFLGITLTNSKAFREINGFDERFFPSQWEDCDLTMRLKEGGYEILYVGGLAFVHNDHHPNFSAMGSHNYFFEKWRERGWKLGTKKGEKGN